MNNNLFRTINYNYNIIIIDFASYYCINLFTEKNGGSKLEVQNLQSRADPLDYHIVLPKFYRRNQVDSHFMISLITTQKQSHYPR